MEEQEVLDVVTPEVNVEDGTLEEVVEVVKTNKNYVGYGVAGAVIVGLSVLGYKKVLKPFLKKHKEEKLPSSHAYVSVDKSHGLDANDVVLDVEESEEE